MSCWALIALKAPSSAKGRLADILTLDERRLLVERMLAHVLAALQASPQIAGIAIVTNEPIRGDDILRIDDPGQGLNRALSHGAATLAARGVTRVVMLHADLPLLTAGDVAALLDAAGPQGQSIAPDKTGQGSNALCLPLPLPICLHFGADSQRRHQQAARQAGLRLPQVSTPGLALDIDERQDLERLIETAAPDWQFLASALQRPPSS